MANAYPAGGISDAAVSRVMRSVAAELARNRGVEAVRLFKDGLDHGIVPAGADLRRWLLKAIGKEATAKLVSAYAQHPCFYCKSGLEQCVQCRGAGHWEDGTVCGACITTGVGRCDFCDGTGLVTYNAMPAGLRLPVAIERVQMASRGLEVLLKRSSPSPSKGQPHECLKQCAKRMTDVNRFVGVFENAVVLARTMSQSKPQFRPILAKILGVCIQHATEAFERLRAIIECMEKCAACESQDDSLTPAARDFAARRTRLLQSLKPSSAFPGTVLEHAFLLRAVERFRRTKARRQRAQGRREPS